MGYWNKQDIEKLDSPVLFLLLFRGMGESGGNSDSVNARIMDVSRAYVGAIIGSGFSITMQELAEE